MFFRHVLSLLTRFIVVLALLATIYLYLYPVWFGCAFPSTTGGAYDGFRDTVVRHLSAENDARLAPFRLLVLADPQLEGDSSLPDPDDALLTKLNRHTARLRHTNRPEFKDAAVEVLRELLTVNIPDAFWTLRKSLDLFGNDYYLAHIYRRLHWWTKPTHVTVLGDLIGSQWTDDDEFAWRGWRYWNRVLAGTSMVDEDIMDMHNKDVVEQASIPIEQQSSTWATKVINVAGNHDIGYAGDISPSRIERFETTFGKTNWDVHFTYPISLLPADHANPADPPTLQLVVLNSMLLDTPAFSGDLQDEQYQYINGLISKRLLPVSARNHTFTLLLTHVPLYKPAGVCVDSPFFEFWDYEDADGKFFNGGLREQNHLSDHTSRQGILQSIFGMSGNDDASEGGVGRRGLILTGHDHEGCDVVHYIVKEENPSAEVEARDVAEENSDHDDAAIKQMYEQTDTEFAESTELTPDQPSWSWHVNRTADFYASTSNLTQQAHTSLREITIRSMMGEYSGNAGLLSLWYDFDAGQWDYKIQMCSLGVQHVWWSVHVVDLVAIGLVLLQLALKAHDYTAGKGRYGGAAGKRPASKHVKAD